MQDKMFRVDILTFQKANLFLPLGSKVQKDDDKSAENKHLENVL